MNILWRWFVCKGGSPFLYRIVIVITSGTVKVSLSKTKKHLNPKGLQLSQSSHLAGDRSMMARHKNPSSYISTDLELLRLPSSERFFAEPLFLESQDFTPSTRSSNSESESESP